MNEEEVTGAGYIIKFFEDLELLNDSYAQLVNSLTNIKAKVSKEELVKEDLENIEDTDLSQIKNAADTLRYYITRTYIKSQALREKVPPFKEPKIKEIFDTVKEKTIVELNTFEDYVITINTCFVGGILEQLLVNAKDIYSKLTT